MRVSAAWGDEMGGGCTGSRLQREGKRMYMNQKFLQDPDGPEWEEGATEGRAVDEV